MKFTKMHGLGNDYIFLFDPGMPSWELPKMAVRYSDRHFGIGSDGLICIFPSEVADFRMEIYNADGSQGEMCGNGIRCLGKYVYDRGLVHKTELRVETKAGLKTLELHVSGGRVNGATVDMGEPAVYPERKIDVNGDTFTVHPVSIGNPHAVVYITEIGSLDLRALGPGFECHPSFPNRTNTEFVEVESKKLLRMRVWERGSGETLACGTGACAALAASAGLGLTDRETTVRLPGGELQVRWSEKDNHIYMTGPAVHVFEGEV